MTRRSGVLVLLAALLVLVATAWRPGPIDGTAAPEPVSGPPAVGECVSEPVQQYPGYGGGTGQTYVYPQLAVAPCTGTRFAEVVSVLDTPAEPQIVARGSSLNVSDPNQSACRTAVQDYLGTAVTVDPAGTIWSTVTTVEVSVTRPAPRQEAAGQHWLACLAAARGSTYPEQDPAPYDGTLRDAIATGAARDRLGACATAPDLDTGYPAAACSRPHTVQLLATARELPAGTPTATVTDGCRWTAERLTGLTDVTAAGALTVLVLVSVDGRTVGGDVVPAGALVACGLGTVGGRTLSGGLVGLGAGALPWT